MAALHKTFFRHGGVFFDNCIVLNNCNKRMYALYMLLIFSNLDLIKLLRAYGECLGINRR